MKNKFFKNLWFWLIVLGALIFVVNVLVLIFVKDNIWKSAWLTLISGWVSGFATIVLGLIAFSQNKKYKIENDAFLNEQQRINAKLTQEQSDLLWRKSQYDIYQAYKTEFLDCEKEFSKYSVSEVSAQILGTQDEMRAIADLSIIDKRIRSNITRNFAFF